MNLTIALATRGRRHLLSETVERTVRNIALSGTTLVILVDSDDGETIEAATKFSARTHCAVSIAPREDSLGAKYNRAIKTHPADVYMGMTDYAPIETRGFDERVIKAASAYPDGIAYVHGNLANLSFPSLQAVTHKMAAAMGGMYPEIFPYWFLDHWLDDIGKMTGRVSYADVAVDCSSRRPGRTIELREPAFWASLYDAAYPLRRDQADRVLSASHEPLWRKIALERNYPLYAQRSRMINDMCRTQSTGIESLRESQPTDERYNRIREKARAMILDLYAQLQQEAASAA